MELIYCISTNKIEPIPIHCQKTGYAERKEMLADVAKWKFTDVLQNIERYHKSYFPLRVIKLMLRVCKI